MNSPNQLKQSLPKRLALLILQIGVVILALMTVLGFGGGINWLMDLTNHFRLIYGLLQLLVLFPLLLLRSWRWASCNAIMLLLNVGQILPLYLPRPQQAVRGEPFKVVQLNVCAPVKDYRRMNDFFRQERPDLITLEECAEHCVADLHRDGIWNRYPYRFRKSPERHRLVILSRLPIVKYQPLDLHADPAIALLELKLGEHPISLLVMHSTRPSSGAPYHRNQIQQFAQIAERVKSSSQPFLMMGDLNTTPWGYSLRKLLADSGLRNSMAGFGIQPSFPVFVPGMPQNLIRPFFPIDQILVSRQFAVLSRSTGPVLDSDHLPVIAELQLTAAN